MFLGSRVPVLCDDSYWVCNVLAGCVLDESHYVEGTFPGVRRVVVVTEEEQAGIVVRLFLETMTSPGTEFFIQLYDTDCTLDSEDGVVHWLDEDMFDVAGGDRTLTFEFPVSGPGEHLLELYADANASYLMVVDPVF